MGTRIPSPMTTVVGMDTNILTTPASYDGKTPTTFGFDVASTKSVGLAKLAGKVVKLLWTQKGSNPISPAEGTDLVSIYSDSVGDQSTLFAFVSICINDAQEQIIAQQALAGAKLEETLASIQLVSAILELKGIQSIYHITISIYSAAGELYTFELPSTIA